MKFKSTAYLWMCLILSTLVVGQAHARKAVEEDTDKLNKKLRVVNDKGEMDDYKANITEVLITKNEAQAMQQLNKLIGKYKGSPLEPGLLYRKAELFVRQSKSARFFEFNRAEGNLLTLIPATMKSATSLGKTKQAVEIYEEIERRFPNYSELDSVLFNNGFLRQQLSQDDKAEKIFRSLIRRFPDSFLIPDTHLALAEMLYQKRRYNDALVDYEAIKQYPLARVYPYAIYKTGWTKYQLKDVDGAMKELELVIDVTDKIAAQENSKINLKEEALKDLVLFYPEAKLAKNAYAYFKKFAGDKTGQYIISLSKMYERHSQFVELETVLNDLISNMPESEDTSLAYKMIVENDLTARSYEKATEHLTRFETHCLKYFKNDYTKTAVVKDPKKKVIDEDIDDDVKSCPMVLAKESLKLSIRWHKEWQNKSKKSKEATLDKSDLKRIDDIADATELAYSIYLRNSEQNEKKETVRFNYAELLFQRKKFRVASDEYFKVAKSIKDDKIMHESSYYAIVSLESAVGDKWNDTDENKYTELAQLYITKNPTGKFVNEVKYKKAFIAYEKGRYAEALPAFKQIGWGKGDEKLVIKSQDLFLDILNIQKAHKELIESTDHLIALKPSPERKEALLKINRESQFALGNELEKKGDFEEAVAIYNKFAHENLDSKLADKAMWNLTQILIKKNEIKKAADQSFELYKLFPKSEFAMKSLQKSAELYEFLADTHSAAIAVGELAKVDTKESLKWSKVSADFYVLSGEFKKGVDGYREILKTPDEKIRKDIVSALTRLDASNIYANKEVKDLINKYGGAKYSNETILGAKKAYADKNATLAFKLASQVVGDKDAPSDVQAQARFIQSEILKDEFVLQSVKTKVDRLEMVLTLKTEKLDKAQRAYQATVKYGDPSTTLRAFYSMAKMYQHYVEALKGIQISGDITEKDKKLLLSEIEKIIIPIEEKIPDTLQAGIDFAKKYPAYDGYAFELKNELNKVNFKGLKYVKYNVEMPKAALPNVN
jgi:TolA-binding protein